MAFDDNILQRLNEIGIALSKERRIPLLFEKILSIAKELTKADGGSIYTVVDRRKKLHFEVMMSDSLHFHLGGTSSKLIPFEDLPLFLENGDPNNTLMVAYVVNHNTTINVKDAYFEQGFDFSGTKEFDKKTGYRTKAVLTVPMRNHEGEVIAVIQLINPGDSKGSFSEEDVQLTESLASQAGIALTNRLLIQNLRHLFESLIRVITEAVDEKSPSTGNHGKRVPILSFLLAQAVNETEEGVFADLAFNEDQIYELQIASLLHDCGKITTPVHVVEKKTKLETIFDRIEMVDTRFESMEFKEENALLRNKLRWLETHYPQAYIAVEDAYSYEANILLNQKKQWEDDRDFIHRCNEQKEPITEEAMERIKRIADLTWGVHKPLLTSDEVNNLLVPKGNLTQEEREIIQNHVVMTYRMLSQLPFPKELANVPEIAASHHERMDGKGYPRRLKGEDMLIQSRILIIADVFEALSAPDRPYRKAAPLSKVLSIMQEMVEEGHIDPELFKVFLKKKVYLEYAKRHLMPEQIDVE